MVTLETWLVGAILAIDLIGLTLDFKSFKLYKNYFKERTKWYQSRGKTKATVAVVPTVAVDANAPK